MANRVISKDMSCTERFIKKYSRHVPFPSSEIMDVKFHPFYRDHFVVLSSNSFPEDAAVDCYFNFGKKHRDLAALSKEFGGAFQSALDIVSEQRAAEEEEKEVSPTGSRKGSLGHITSAQFRHADDVMLKRKGYDN